MNIKEIVKKYNLESNFTQPEIGIEKESHRINKNADLAQTPHPTVFGNRSHQPYIQTDFAESQIELITPPFEKTNELSNFLQTLHQITLRNIPANEYIWPFSMPPHLPEEKNIQIVQLENKKEKQYRQYLADKYGKYKQLLCGIHYNFGFNTNFIEKISNITKTDKAQVQNEIYMQLAQQFLQHQWILIYLFGATPTVDPTYFKNKLSQTKNTKLVRSLRTSKYGYVNEENIKVSFSSLEKYITDIEKYVKNKQLLEEKEFYSPVRLKGTEKVKDFLTQGIKYLELRLFDLNPFTPYAISEKDIKFIKVFMLALLWVQSAEQQTNQNIKENVAEKICLGKKLAEETSLQNPFEKIKQLDKAKKFFKQMVEMATECDLDQTYIDIIKEKEKQLENPNETICAKLCKKIEYIEKKYKIDTIQAIEKIGLNIAKINKNNAEQKKYCIKSYENMELSTQALISDAIQYGIQVEILDKYDQFIKLTYKNHEEYVKNGNMTSKDNYITPLIMENKLVTKKILANKGFNVPKSIQLHYSNCITQPTINTKIDSNIVHDIFEQVKNKKIVIKPKTTNFGLGITIFKKPVTSQTELHKAIELAFEKDNEIMIEQYLPGKEYRFFTVNYQTKAVLFRIPANVTGNGHNTIKQLIDEKNSNPLRGDGLTTPLKKIHLGELEKLHLKLQNIDLNYVPKKDEIIYLRANSNISTGGDSIDVTDIVDSSYINIANTISKTLGAKVCGIDLIIPNITSKYDEKENPYGLIEVNHNPMMMMHIYPYKGKSRRLTLNILELLFPEVFEPKKI